MITKRLVISFRLLCSEFSFASEHPVRSHYSYLIAFQRVPSILVWCNRIGNWKTTEIWEKCGRGVLEVLPTRVGMVSTNAAARRRSQKTSRQFAVTQLRNLSGSPRLRLGYSRSAEPYCLRWPGIGRIFRYHARARTTRHPAVRCAALFAGRIYLLWTMQLTQKDSLKK